MKSRLPSVVYLWPCGLRPTLMLLALAIVTGTMPTHAQETLKVDPQHSVARLSLGSGSNALEVGLARVSGEVVFDSNDSADPFVSLKIVPDNGPRAEYAEISFASQRSVMRADGKLVVTGDLSVTRVERSVTMEPNEAYAGPQYGEPVAHSDTRQIALVFSDPRQFVAQNRTVEFSGTSSVSREVFPQLVDALAPGNWPTMLVDDEKCQVPSTVGDDYSGANCIGTVIATVTNNVVMVGTAGGEDYSGFQTTATPDRKQATIALNLKLEEVSPPSSVHAGSQGQRKMDRPSNKP